MRVPATSGPAAAVTRPTPSVFADERHLEESPRTLTRSPPGAGLDRHARGRLWYVTDTGDREAAIAAAEAAGYRPVQKESRGEPVHGVRHGDDPRLPAHPAAEEAPRAGCASVAHFWVWLTLVSLLALVVRVAYTELASPTLGYDATYFHLLANRVATGAGFTFPYRRWIFRPAHPPSAIHPPLFPILLAAVSVAHGTSAFAHRLVGCWLGAGTVFTMGMLGRRLLGDVGGLVVAALVAVYPNLWALDALVMSESLFALIIALTLVASYRWIERPSLTRAAALGAAVGAATLTRGEGILLIPLLLAPVMLLRRRLPRGHRATSLAVASVVAILCLAPWTIYNLGRFKHPVIISTGGGGWLLAVTNCGPTYNGDLVGFWSGECFQPLQRLTLLDETVDQSRGAAQAKVFIRSHLLDVPRVVALRVARQWELYRPLQNARLASQHDDDARPLWLARLGLIAYYALIPLAATGLVALRRNRTRLTPLVSMIALVTATAALSYGTARFRAPAELALCVLAGAAITGRFASLPTPRIPALTGDAVAGEAIARTVGRSYGDL